MSSDSDFTPLVMRLREAGKLVLGFGESKAPAAFVEACDHFETIAAGKTKGTRGREGRSEARRRQERHGEERFGQRRKDHLRQIEDKQLQQ